MFQIDLMLVRLRHELLLLSTHVDQERPTLTEVVVGSRGTGIHAAQKQNELKKGLQE
jgi:hypothetical protein